jgi:hypothetical protein
VAQQRSVRADERPVQDITVKNNIYKSIIKSFQNHSQSWFFSKIEKLLSNNSLSQLSIFLLEKPIPTCGKYAIRWPIRRWKDMEKNKKYEKESIKVIGVI